MNVGAQLFSVEIRGSLEDNLIAASFLLPAHPGQGKRDIAKALGLASAYFWLPLYLIWSGDRDDLSSLQCLLYRISGWLFLTLPAVVIAALWLAK